MSSVEKTLTSFYRAFDPTKALDADDRRYYGLDEPVDDQYLRGEPSVRSLLQQTIRRADGPTAQLMSGFRGAGKTTELRRLAADLTLDNYFVVYADAADYLNLAAPLDIASLLLSIAGSISQRTKELVGGGFDGGSRFLAALKNIVGATIDLTSIEFNTPGFKGKLRLSPAFGEELRKSVAMHQSQFILQFQEFVTDCVSRIRENQESRAIVFIFDSLEHLQGDVVSSEDVFESVRLVFSQFSEALCLPGCHAIYSVPPYLRVLLPGAPAGFTGGDVRLLPMVKLWGQDPGRPVYRAGVDALVKLVANRFDYQDVLGRDQLERIVMASGGYLRDLFRLMQETTYDVDRLPVDDKTVERAIKAVARSYKTLADSDKTWLRSVRDTRSMSLPQINDLRRHAQLFDTHLLFCYRNDEEWYDVHPLIRDWLGTEAPPPATL